MPIPVRMEILSGVSRAQEPRLRRALSGLPLLFPTDATWERIDGWIGEAAQRGHRFAVGDLLIAAIAVDHGMPLWSLDSDFQRMRLLGFIDTSDANQSAGASKPNLSTDPPGAGSNLTSDWTLERRLSDLTSSITRYPSHHRPSGSCAQTLFCRA